MTADERFERIERNLDMLIQIHLDNDREYRERLDRLASSIEELSATTKELRAKSKEDGEHILALARIAEIHERRLSSLEGGEDEEAES